MSQSRSLLPVKYAPTRRDLIGTGVMGTVYVVHFSRPLAHARHYTGWTGGDIRARMALHRAGYGGRLMASVQAAGISWSVVHAERGDRWRERQVKNQSSGARRLCWACRLEETVMAQGSVPYLQTRNRAHVAQFEGEGRWRSICGYQVRRAWPYVHWTSDARPARPWCPWCVSKVRTVAAAVLPELGEVA